MPLIYPGKSSLPALGLKGQEEKDECFSSNSMSMCRGNVFKLNSIDPAYQYQTQKIIQNTVRVPSSLYSSDLGALTVYQRPILKTRVNWNQMSDRALPHYQTNSGNSQGSFYHGSSVKHTQTRCRPGAGTPGGAGVDIKHNSYYRYMDRLKAKKDIRRGVIPPTFGLPIPFNPGFPVYGGKTVKTSIVSGCGCPDSYTRTLRDDILIYRDHFDPKMFDLTPVYEVGSYVYARAAPNMAASKAVILEVNSINNMLLYTIQFVDDSSVVIVDESQLIPYFPCTACNACKSCDDIHENYESGYKVSGKTVEFCYLLNWATGPNYLANIASRVYPAL